MSIISEYIEFVPKPLSPQESHTLQRLHLSNGAASELLELALNEDYYEDPEFMKEVGDVLWYSINLLLLEGTTPADIEEIIIQKTSDDPEILILAEDSVKLANSILDHYKKIIFYKQDITPNILDVFMEFMSYFNVGFIMDCMIMNKNKLSARYPNLVFTTQASIERKDECQPLD